MLAHMNEQICAPVRLPAAIVDEAEVVLPSPAIFILATQNIAICWQFRKLTLNECARERGSTMCVYLKFVLSYLCAFVL